jgi:hypothetical protein
MKSKPSEPVDLTVPQRRELERIADATDGQAEGKGAEWAVRARLRKAGLVELRTFPEIRLGRSIVQSAAHRWFITEAGQSILRSR